ncbi:PAS domain-containing protein [Echinicola marina]|uniref:PAS domain-containing protein n=1 Tax=Echinicola marina TaxID=2859768 RepID=UPI001CF61994|nr:PAS domain-containing protein [Echinicola marina]UCS91922.1 PAS domain-containing protein [Echinicola marina]
MDYKKLFYDAPIPLIISNEEGEIEIMNESARKFLNINDGHVLTGVSILELLAPLQVSFAQSFINFYKGLNTRSDYMIKLRDGSEVYTRISSSSIKSKGKNRFVFSFQILISDDRLVNELKDQVKERVKEQLAILNVIDALFKFSEINEAIANCLPAICKGWRFPDATIARIELTSGEVFASKNFKETEWMMRADIKVKEGKIGFIEVGYLHEVPLFGGSVFLFEETRLINILSSIIGLFIEQWRDSQKVRENEQVLRKITNQAPCNTYMFEIDETEHVNILFANQGADDHSYSFDMGDLIKSSRKFREALHEEDRVPFIEAMKSAYHSNTLLSIQYRIEVNHEIRWRWLKALPEKSKNGKIIWYGTSHDITPIANYINTTEQILFDISHVIRKPIASILGLANMISSSDLSERELVDLSAKLQEVTNELDSFLSEINHAYSDQREANALLHFDFNPLIDQRKDLF